MSPVWMQQFYCFIYLFRILEMIFTLYGKIGPILLKSVQCLKVDNSLHFIYNFDGFFHLLTDMRKYKRIVLILLVVLLIVEQSMSQPENG